LYKTVASAKLERKEPFQGRCKKELLLHASSKTKFKRSEITEMKKLFQNKFFLICVCIAVVLCAVPSTFALMGYRGLSKNLVGTVTAPLRWCVTVVGDAFEGFGRYFTSIDAMQKKNEELESENQALREQIEAAEQLERENERLREYLEIKSQNPTFQMEEGMVIGHSSGNYATNYTLNRGTLHGIEVNMPVIVREGIVGYVTDVGLNWCMVATIIETASWVGAYVPRSGVTGIVSGDYSMREDGVCKITFMD
jgi:rod shape-determining protein MreC